MSGLTNLPTELRVHILSYLHPSEDRQTLVSLCVTCKSMLFFVRPMLYADLSQYSLPNESIMHTLCDTEVGWYLGRLVRKASVALQVTRRKCGNGGLYFARQTDAQTQDELDILSGRIVQQKLRSRWHQCMPGLAALTALEEFDFSIKGPMDWASESYGDFTMPSDLVALPFLSTLRCLSLQRLYVPRATFAAFGHLILAAPNLSKLTLNDIPFQALFAPILARLSDEAGQILSLQEVHWVESEIMQEGEWAEDFFVVVAQLPSVCLLSLDCVALAVEALDRYTAQNIRLASITHATFRLQDEFMQECPDWPSRISPFFPNLERLLISVAFDTQFPDQNNFPFLQHLTLVLSAAAAFEQVWRAIKPKDMPKSLTHLVFELCEPTWHETTSDYFAKALSICQGWVPGMEQEALAKITVRCGTQWLEFALEHGSFGLDGGNYQTRGSVNGLVSVVSG